MNQDLIEIVEDVDAELASIATVRECAPLGELLRQVESNPGFADLRYQLAFQYALAGRLEDALRELDRALVINREFADALRLKARLLTDKGELRAALSVCQRVNKLDPTSSDGYLAEAMLHARLGDHAGAIGACRNAIEISRSNVAAHMLLGEQYVRLDELALARRHFELASRWGKDADASYLAGLVCVKLGDVEGAESSFRRALEISPKHRNSAIRLTMLKVREGDNGSAHEILSKLLEHYPSYPDLHYGLARICLLMGRREEAYRRMETALELNPRYAEVRREIATICAGQDDIEAAAHAAKGIEIDPSDEQAAINLGHIYAKAGDLDQAIEVLDRAVERFPESWRVLQALGIVNMQKKAYPDARLALHAAARIQPELESIERSLRIVFRDETLLEDERARLEMEYTAAETKPTKQHRLGRVFLDFGKERQATHYFRESFERGYAPLENAILLSHLHANRSDFTSAIAWLERAEPTGLALQVWRLLHGLFHANTGEHETSTRYYQQVMTESALLFHGLDGLGVCFREREEIEDMLDDYLDYARYNDRSAALFRQIGSAYATKGMLIEARRQFDHATILDIGDGRAFHALGVLSMFRLDFDEAIRLLTIATKRSADWAIPHLLLSLVQLEQGDRFSAMISLQRYIFLEPTACWRELAERLNSKLNDHADIVPLGEVSETLVEPRAARAR